jgi:glycosyltransferase involved in cell wall biosynthesis
MPKAYALLGTYPPTQCGLATFNAALFDHLRRAGEHARVVRVIDEPALHRAPEVVHDLVKGAARSAAMAVHVLNEFDVVIVQHEYGIYSGPDGSDIISLLDALRVPSIVVLHTVLARPTARQRTILVDVIDAASAVVTMTQTARSRLLAIYGADPAKVSVIPHGSADFPAAPVRRRQNPGPMALTWGLLGPGKGIEHVIDAVALLRGGGLRVAYTVAGGTHPRVQARDGEAYRRLLEKRATAQGVGDLVRFDRRYLPADALSRIVGAADVVVLPYDSLEQVTSGVLIEAVTAGKPVISTSFPHAVELLADGAGLLVQRQDPKGIADALHRVLREPGLAARMSRHSAEIAPSLLWPAVANRYRDLAVGLIGAARTEAAV